MVNHYCEIFHMFVSVSNQGSTEIETEILYLWFSLNGNFHWIHAKSCWKYVYHIFLQKPNYF